VTTAPTAPVLPVTSGSAGASGSTGTSGSPAVNANTPVDTTGNGTDSSSSRTGTLANANAPVETQTPNGAGSSAVAGHADHPDGTGPSGDAGLDGDVGITAGHRQCTHRRGGSGSGVAVS
jgi:hypothetical protein